MPSESHFLCFRMPLSPLFVETVCLSAGGWSGGAMILRKILVPGRPTDLDNDRVRNSALAGSAGVDCLDIFPPNCLFSLLSHSLWEMARYRLKYCLKGPLNPKQTTPIPLITFNKICLT